MNEIPERSAFKAPKCQIFKPPPNSSLYSDLVPEPRFTRGAREQSGIELFSNRLISSAWVNLETYIRMIGFTAPHSVMATATRKRIRYALAGPKVWINLPATLRQPDVVLG